MKYLKNIKVLLIISFSLFLISFISGLYMGEYIQLIDSEDELIRHSPSLSLSLDLFTNNVLICITLILGVFLFSIPTIALLLLNGFFFGMGVKSFILIGLSGQEILIKILPHGIFEIPAIIISGGLGLLGLSFYFNPKKEFKGILKKGTMTVLILIFLAAVVEGLITVIL